MTVFKGSVLTSGQRSARWYAELKAMNPAKFRELIAKVVAKNRMRRNRATPEQRIAQKAAQKLYDHHYHINVRKPRRVQHRRKKKKQRVEEEEEEGAREGTRGCASASESASAVQISI